MSTPSIARTASPAERSRHGRVAPLARRPALVRPLGRGGGRRRRPRRQQRGRRPGPARPRLVDRLAARRPPARDGRGTDAPGARRVDGAPRRPDAASPTTAGTRSSSTVAATSTSTASASTSAPARSRSRGSSPSSPRTGSARQVADGIEFPNGMVVTPDNSTLIISESFAGRLTAFDIAADGSLSNRRVWADGVGPDGICLDAEGAIWTAVGATRARTPDATTARKAHASGSARVARSCSGSSSTAPASRACSAVPIDGRCSCWRPSGAASRTSTR